MCVEGESPTTNNFLNTRAKANRAMIVTSQKAL